MSLWLLPKWAAYDLEWYNHQKLSEDDTWFLRPLAWRTRRYIIRTFINNKLCKARKGWRCLPTTVPVDIVRHVCIESSPWLVESDIDWCSVWLRLNCANACTWWAFCVLERPVTCVTEGVFRCGSDTLFCFTYDCITVVRILSWVTYKLSLLISHRCGRCLTRGDMRRRE